VLLLGRVAGNGDARSPECLSEVSPICPAEKKYYKLTETKFRVVGYRSPAFG
jgi:hypothetical protein